VTAASSAEDERALSLSAIRVIATLPENALSALVVYHSGLGSALEACPRGLNVDRATCHVRPHVESTSTSSSHRAHVSAKHLSQSTPSPPARDVKTSDSSARSALCEPRDLPAKPLHSSLLPLDTAEHFSRAARTDMSASPAASVQELHHPDQVRHRDRTHGSDTSSKRK